MWHEAVASPGSAECASCLWHWLKTLQERNQHPTHLIGFADACGRPKQAVRSTAPSMRLVDQVFMVSGHSFLPSDEDCGVD